MFRSVVCVDSHIHISPVKYKKLTILNISSRLKVNPSKKNAPPINKKVSSNPHIQGKYDHPSTTKTRHDDFLLSVTHRPVPSGMWGALASVAASLHRHALFFSNPTHKQPPQTHKTKRKAVLHLTINAKYPSPNQGRSHSGLKSPSSTIQSTFSPSR